MNKMGMRNRGNYRDRGQNRSDQERYWQRSGEGSDSRYGNNRGSYEDRLYNEGSRSSGYSGMYPDSGYQSEGYFGGGDRGPSFGGGYQSGGYSDRGMSDTYGGGYDRDRWTGSYGGYDRDRSSGSYGGGGDYRSEQGGSFGGGYGRGGSGSGYYSGSSSSGGYDYGRDSSWSRSDYPSSERGYQSGRGRDDRGFWDKASDEVASWFGDEEAERRRERDERRGEHWGRGPKGYTRSDDRIKEDINDRLTDHSYLDASDIEVEVNNCEVTLTGTVDSRYAKRTAEDIAEQVSGVRNVENRIRYNSDRYSGFNSGFSSDDMDTSSSSTSRMTTGSTGTAGTTGTKAASTGK